MPVTGGLALAIRLGFHNHAPEKLAIGLALHQQAADQLGGNLLGGAGEEILVQSRQHADMLLGEIDGSTLNDRPQNGHISLGPD
jgi:hypothetical protein